MKSVIAAAILFGCASFDLAHTARISTTGYVEVLRHPRCVDDASSVTLDGWVFGTQYDVKFNPMYSSCNVIVSNNPDYTALHKVREGVVPDTVPAASCQDEHHWHWHWQLRSNKGAKKFVSAAPPADGTACP
jgi:hypothetical protein